MLAGAAASVAALPRWARAEGDLSSLIAAATAEGSVNFIGSPRDWAGCGAVLDGFTAKYGITVNHLNPTATLPQKYTAMTSPAAPGQAPDGMDISPEFLGPALQQSLLASYKPVTWNSIPNDMKDPNGKWLGDYFGIAAFATNTSVVPNAPQSWADLKKPDYKGMVALNGHPYLTGAALAAVFAASLANGGSFDNIEPGIDYFAELASIGNLNHASATDSAMLVSGQAPIVISWDFLLLTYRDAAAKRAPLTVTIPQGSPAFGSYYCQVLPTDAANPNAAKLLEEYFFSDEGQLLRLNGYAHPARFAYLVENDLVPATVSAKLLPAASYTNLTFPTLAQYIAANKTVADLWPKLVKI
jgi:putative spermidine/putrescine transport system substrate-binding protein